MLKTTRKFKLKKRLAKRGEYKRLSNSDRRRHIIDKSTYIFSLKGFPSTTTRELADELGISEALLFKHFKTKDDLVRAIEKEVQLHLDQIFQSILSRPPTAETLAFAIGFNIFVLSDGFGFAKEKSAVDRLVVFSLMNDGRFFKRTNEENLPKYFQFLNRCKEDAIERKLLHDDGRPLENKLWFCHHVAGFMGLAKHSNAIGYVGESDLVNQDAIQFCMKAVGFTETALRQFSDPKWILSQLGPILPG